MTCLRFPKIAGEPVGAPWIFENHIQAKRLHSSSGTNPLIQVFLILGMAKTRVTMILN